MSQNNSNSNSNRRVGLDDSVGGSEPRPRPRSIAHESLIEGSLPQLSPAFRNRAKVWTGETMTDPARGNNIPIQQCITRDHVDTWLTN